MPHGQPDGGAARAVHPAVSAARRQAGPGAVLAVVCALLVPIGLWQIVALYVHSARTPVFPTPYETFLRLLQLLGGKHLVEFTFYRHIADSLARWGVGFGIAMALGVTTGLLLGWSRILERLVMPTVTVLQLIPGLAWILPAMLMFGLGERSTIFMIAVTALPPIIINATAGVKGVSDMYLRAARMMGVSDRTLFVRVLLPGALPHILSGLRVGLANGWRVVVAAEMIVGTGTGLGYSIFQTKWSMDYSGGFACIVAICIVGLMVERGILLPLERRTVERWGLARSA